MGSGQGCAFDQLGKQIPGPHPGESGSRSAVGPRKLHFQHTLLR